MLSYFQDKPVNRKRLRRRGFPIHIYAGPNGSGKSAAAAYGLIPSLDNGRPVLSTMRLLDFRNPRPCEGGLSCDDPGGHVRKRRVVSLVPDPEGGRDLVEFVDVDTEEIHPAAHPYFVPLTSYSQVLNWRDGDILLDEAAGVVNSRESGSMPSELQVMLQQLRRRNISLIVTAPSISRVDVILRECAQAVSICYGHLPKRVRPVKGEAPKLWRQNRVIHIRTYDASLVSDFENEAAVTMQPMFSQFLWVPGSELSRVYDTYDSVRMLGFAGATGQCMSCGGQRRKSPCSCADHRRHGDALRAVAPASEHRETVRLSNA